MLSVIIPSRNERFLAKTVDDLFAKASGAIEVIAVLDGYWPQPILTDRPNLILLHRGAWQGMRPAINSAARIAHGDYLMKTDGHCLFAEGFDEALKADCEDDWIVVPRRYSLDAENWTILETGKAPVDAHFLSYPFERPGDRTCGLHGEVWRERARERKEILIDDEMSSQGSCWFMSRTHWNRLGEMEVEGYGSFSQEMQELANKTWLGGGRVVVNKRTWYAHLHKGKRYGTGYSFNNEQWKAWAIEKESARTFCIDWWLNDRWTARVRDFQWLLERFWPVPVWPGANPAEAMAIARQLCRGLR